jgi:hypothetical protein
MLLKTQRGCVNIFELHVIPRFHTTLVVDIIFGAVYVKPQCFVWALS